MNLCTELQGKLGTHLNVTKADTMALGRRASFRMSVERESTCGHRTRVELRFKSTRLNLDLQEEQKRRTSKTHAGPTSKEIELRQNGGGPSGLTLMGGFNLRIP